ncbi:MAG: Amuc_1099 family pilus-like system protein [Opitutaceae bacterium]
MDWIKKHFDQFALALLAAVLIAVGVMIFMKTSGFQERFAAVMSSPPHNNQIPAVDTAVIDDARRQLETPAVWKPRSAKDDQNGGLLFSARRYILGPNGLPVIVEGGAIWTHSRTKESIPNDWVLANNFNALDPAGATQDPDGDGFWNEDEWLYKTDPNKKESHPPYHVLLFLKEWVKVQFRLKFQVYDGDLKDPANMTFQINTIDLRTPTLFLKIGDTVATNFKITKFEFKEVENRSTGVKDDVSELTLLNMETQDTVVLILNKVVDSPNQFAVFAYHLVAQDVSDGKKPFEFKVPRLKEFVLRPETDKRYKLLDVTATEAVIQLPDGQKYTVPTYQAGPPK